MLCISYHLWKLNSNKTWQFIRLAAENFTRLKTLTMFKRKVFRKSRRPNPWDGLQHYHLEVGGMSDPTKIKTKIWGFQSQSHSSQSKRAANYYLTNIRSQWFYQSLENRFCFTLACILHTSCLILPFIKVCVCIKRECVCHWKRTLIPTWIVTIGKTIKLPVI